MNHSAKPFFAVACPSLAVTLLCTSSALAGGTTVGDFNGDGFADLAIGVPTESVGAESGAGAVNVIYGSAAGLHESTAVANQLWHQNKAGIEGTCNSGDDFGAALASGDFDGDGFYDLAIGAPGEAGGLGAVNVIYGSASGLAAAGDQLWTQSNLGLTNDVAQIFGSSLAAGDFNNDGRDDLAIGAPFDSSNALNQSVFGAGSVTVVYGTANGLAAANRQLWDQSVVAGDTREPLEAFGWAVAAGDFNNDGFDDLAVGVPDELVVAVAKAGAVHIILGSAARLTAVGAQFWHQNSAGVLDACEAEDRFGASLAAGDFDNDGFDDLAVGAPGESVGGGANAGQVHIFYGVAAGVNASRDQIWNQDSANILEEVDPTEAGEGFGFSLATGFFNDDTFCDLAIGAPNEDFLVPEVGVTHVLYGRGTGLKPTANQVWSQDTNGVLDVAEDGDHLGFSLAVGDFNGDGRDDLSMGAPGETIGVAPNCGAVTVLYGKATKFTASDDQIWHQNRPGILDSCEENDSFGTAGAP